jgi:glutathione peroxidase
MKVFLLITLFVAAAAVAAAVGRAADTGAPGPLRFTMKDIDGKDVNLGDYKGKVVMFVNVASECGYTPQYAGLEALYQKHKADGFVIIGVPANQFGGQEPGGDAEIKRFCTGKYHVTFPMMSKVVVKGDGICPLYKFLTGNDTDPRFAGDVAWNFEKFLVSRKGEVVNRFRSKVTPESEQMEGAVQAELKKPAG